MKHSKINKALVSALCASSLIVCGISINQTVAQNNSFSTTSESTVAYMKNTNTYSDEVELNSAAEPQYSEAILEKKQGYKVIFEKKLSSRLEKISSEKLEKIYDILDEKLENIDLDKHEKKIAQILALLELIQHELELREEYSIELDLEELFNV